MQKMTRMMSSRKRMMTRMRSSRKRMMTRMRSSRKRMMTRMRSSRKTRRLGQVRKSDMKAKHALHRLQLCQ
jgi:hypothetical protein